MGVDLDPPLPHGKSPIDLISLEWLRVKVNGLQSRGIPIMNTPITGNVFNMSNEDYSRIVRLHNLGYVELRSYPEFHYVVSSYGITVLKFDEL